MYSILYSITFNKRIYVTKHCHGLFAHICLSLTWSNLLIKLFSSIQAIHFYHLNGCYSGIFYFCQYLHIGAGILSFGGDVFRL